MSVQVAYNDVQAGTEIAPVSYRATRLSLVKYCGRLRRLQRDPLERADRQVGGAAERDRARHVHDGAGRALRHRLGRVRARRWSSTASGLPRRSSCLTTHWCDDRGQRHGRGKAGRQPCDPGAHGEVRRGQGPDPGARPWCGCPSWARRGVAALAGRAPWCGPPSTEARPAQPGLPPHPLRSQRRPAGETRTGVALRPPASTS